MLARSALIYAPAVILPRLASFSVVLMLTHALPAAEFGFYALVILIGEMLDMGTSNWIRFSMLRLDIGTPSSWRGGFRRSYVLTAGAVCLSAAVAAAVAGPMAKERAFDFFLALSLYAAANSFSRIGLTALQMRERRAAYSLIEVSRSLTILFGAATALMVGVKSFLPLIAVTSAITLAFGALTVTLGRRDLPPELTASTGYLDRLKYGSSLIVLTFFSYFVLGSDRILLKLLSGPAAVGIYAAAYVLGRQPIDMVMAAVNQAGFPELMKRFDQRGEAAAREFLESTWRLQTLLTIGTFGMICGLAPALAKALLPAAYAPTAQVLLPMICGASLLQNMKSGVFDNIFHVFRRNWLQLASYYPAAFAAAITGWVAIPLFGATGAAASALAGMAAGLLGSVLLTRRLIPIRVIDGEFLKSVVIALCGCGASAGAAWLARGAPPMIDLGVGFVAGAAAWGAALLVLRPEAAHGPLQAAMARVRPKASPEPPVLADQAGAEGASPN